jgi:hypothetical protein
MKAIIIASIVAVMPLISSADHHQPAHDAAKKVETATTKTETTVTKTKEAGKDAMKNAKDMAHKAKADASATKETVKKEVKEATH